MHDPARGCRLASSSGYSDRPATGVITTNCADNGSSAGEGDDGDASAADGGGSTGGDDDAANGCGDGCECGGGDDDVCRHATASFAPRLATARQLATSVVVTTAQRR